MAISFPSSPTTNQTYTAGSKTWIWNGYAWDLVVANTSPIYDYAGAAFNKANSSATISGWAENDLIFANSNGYLANSGINYYTSNNVLLLPTTTTINATTGNVVFSDATFLLQNSSNQTKFARFSAAAQATGTTLVYALPAGSANSSTLIDSESTQTISGTKTFTGSTFTVSAVTTNIQGGATSAVVNIGTAGSAGNQKTINIGTGGSIDSITNINIGPTGSATKSNTRINSPNVIITAANTAQSSVLLQGTKPSTSNITGSLIISGGVGISGNVYASNVFINGLYYASNNSPIPLGGSSITLSDSITSNSSADAATSNAVRIAVETALAYSIALG